MRRLCFAPGKGPAAAVALILLSGPFLAPCARADNEKGLWKLWEIHSASLDDHDAVIGACKTYIAQNRRDPLTVVAKGIASWHLLQNGDIQTAETLLRPQLESPSGALEEGAALVAKGWISRLDREAVKAALQGYYRKEVRYPATLQDLQGHPGVQGLGAWRETDRWGREWNYRLTGLEAFPGLFGQGYSLESAGLKEHSDFAKALAIPYGENIQIRPHRVIQRTDAAPMVQVSAASGAASVGILLGKSLDGVYMAYVGRELVIVCDASHWVVFVRPSGS